jgi:hypothetical protein
VLGDAIAMSLLTALGLGLDWVMLSRCRTYGAWIGFVLGDAIAMSHLRRLGWVGFVRFYRDVVATALGYEVMYWFFNFNSMEIQL